MMWGYRHRGVERTFDTEEELIEWLDAMDPGMIRAVRYWYIKECFVTDEVLECLVDGEFVDVTPEDWLHDALYNIKEAFLDGHYDWVTDTIEGLYYKG